MFGWKVLCKDIIQNNLDGRIIFVSTYVVYTVTEVVDSGGLSLRCGFEAAWLLESQV